MEDSLLHRIYVLGQEIELSLANGDLDGFFERVEERGTLVDEMSRCEPMSEVDPSRKDLGAALEVQYERLTAALAEQEARIQDELAGLQRFKGASRSYQPPETRTQILNENLRV